MHRIFAYGSLQRGEHNHRMMAGARFLTEARTAPAFDLFDLGSFPAMVARGSAHITGELYEVDQALLERLDMFEGCPSLYERKTITLVDGTKAAAYLMRRMRVQGTPRITSGDWKTWKKGMGQ